MAALSKWTPTWLALVFLVLGTSFLGIRQRFELNFTSRVWRKETGVWPFVSRSSGVFADLKCIELERVMVPTSRYSTQEQYEARVVWHKGGPPPKVIFKGTSMLVVAESAARVGRLTGLPLTQSDELRRLRESLQHLPMLE